MQYKIPVQIENEDPIFLWLWLKQLAVIMIGWGIWFTLFDNLQYSIWKEIAAIPSILIFLISVLIAVFKHSEMTFIPFFLSILRNSINPSERRWDKGIDSFQPLDIWYIKKSWKIEQWKVDFKSKFDKLNDLEDKINKL